MLVPGILAKNHAEFKKQWSKVAPYFDYIQIDIVDGVLVPEKNNINPQKIKKLTSHHDLEIHLIVKDVAGYLPPWLKLKNVKKIVWHYEAEPNAKAIHCLNQYLKSKKIKTGLSINPRTTINKIKNILPEFSTIQIMSVYPGRQGQNFQKSSLKKVSALRKKYPKINVEIDGGINDKNFSKVKKSGANLIVLGSYLQKAKSIPRSLEILIS